MRRPIEGAVLVAALVAGCASGPGPTPVSMATTAGPVGPGLVAEGTLEDAVGDLVDQATGAPRGEPGFSDMRGLRAVADGSSLQLTLVMAAELPVAPLPIGTRLSCSISLHLNADAVPESDGLRAGMGYLVAITTLGAREVRVSLADWRGQDQVRFVAFPGTYSIAGDTIVVTLPLAALEDPEVIRLGVWTGLTAIDPGIEGGGATTEDHLPDSRPGADQGWLTLGP